MKFIMSIPVMDLSVWSTAPPVEGAVPGTIPGRLRFAEGRTGLVVKKQELNRMNMCKMGWIVSLLLMVVMAGAAYELVVVGDVVAAPDGRRLVRLNPAERDRVLGEMRDFLVAVQRIIEAAERGDMTAVAESARRVGGVRGCGMQGGAAQMALKAKLPLGFKRLGADTHRRFDDLAQAAEQGAEAAAIRRRLVDLMGDCIACHANYGIAVAREGALTQTVP